MAKDYFQDIVPPANGQDRPSSLPNRERPGTPIPIRTAPAAAPTIEQPASQETAENDAEPVVLPPEPGERSIRNIQASRPRIRPMGDIRADGREVPPIGMSGSRRPRGTRWWLWIAAAVSLIVLAILLFIAFRPTVVTVIPRSHPVSFDTASQFTAYPAATAATGTLPYTLQSSDLEDSSVVASQGTVHAEDKASGLITVYNDLQSAPLKLLKNTRFETPDGLIFRAPAEIVIPGKSASKPGQVSVTVIADQAGEKYNVAPGKFTLPGLKSSPDSYAHVYAQSSAAMTGGFIGDKPGVAPGALESARAEVRSRLEGKARATAIVSESTVSFPDLMQITYQDLPNTTETSGGVRVHESAHVVVPVFAADAFASAVADAISADAGDASIALVPGSGFSAQMETASSSLGADPITFTLSGSARLIWNVDTMALAQALAGRDQAAFQTIVSTVPSIQEAHARIEPFWNKTFPKDPKAIKITVEAVKA